MIKSWWVVCEVYMDASQHEKLIVKANTERKAKAIALNELYRRGYTNVKIVSCKVIE